MTALTLRLRTKLLLYGLVLSVLPLVVTFSVNFFQDIQIGRFIHDKTIEVVGEDLDHIVKGVYSTCNTTQELIQNEVNSALNVANEVLATEGAVQLSSETVHWQAVDQYTKNAQSVQLPKLTVNSKWIGKTDSMQVSSSIVDKVKALVGGTCTIFQQINSSGSMLRVATNVVKKDGTRAVGTYIPAINPDGNPNPVVAAVLSGETYRGRAFVVDRWYITAYAPL